MSITCSVFKGIIDRLSKKNVQDGKQEAVTKESNCHHYNLSPSIQQLTLAFGPERALPHASHSPELCLSKDSSSALNLSLVFQRIPHDSEMDLQNINIESTYLDAHSERTVIDLKELDAVELKHCEAQLSERDNLSTETSMNETLNCFSSAENNCLSGQSLSSGFPNFENVERSRSSDRKLSAIKRKYFTSLDYLRKVQIVSKTLDSEREKLKAKRQALHQILHRLRFLYNVTRLKYSKNKSSLNQNALGALWNLSKFDDSAASSSEFFNDPADRVETKRNIDSSFVPLSNSPLSDCSSRASADQQKKPDRESESESPMELSTSCSSESLEHNDDIVCQEKTHSARPRSSVDDLKSAQNGLHTACSHAENHNVSPHYALSFNDSNFPGTTPSITSECNLSAIAANNCRAHGSSNRLDVAISQTPIQAHQSKRDLTRFTYLYCSADK